MNQPNALLLSLEALFDASQRAGLAPTTETGEERDILLAAYFDDFANDPVTPLALQFQAWITLGWPVAIVTSIPERLRGLVHRRIQELAPDADWSSWPLNVTVHMADYKAGFYGSAVAMEALMQCKSWGGLAIAQVQSNRVAESIHKFFPQAIVNVA